MYDTASAVLMQPPSWVRESKYWQHSKRAVKLTTGELSEVLIHNTVGGLHLTFYSLNGALKAERSLPKALLGRNTVDLVDEQVDEAITVIDGEIEIALGESLPSFGSWKPVQADYCVNHHLGDELAVQQQLRKLGEVQLPRKGRPVIGQAHSVTWPGGSVSPKFYSKFVETKGDLDAYGVLRQEVRTRKYKTFARVLKVEDGKELSLREVLRPDVRERFLYQFEKEWLGVALSQQELSDLDSFRLLIETVGARRAFELIGFCLFWAASGYRTLDDIAKREQVWSRTSQWRAIRDMKKFRAVLAQAEGRDVPPVDDDEIEPVALRLAELKRFAAA